MSPTVVLEWKFSPPDYFEAPIEISQDDYTMIIADGKAEAKIDSAIYEANPSIRDALHDELNARFQAGMLFIHREYHLSSSMICIHPDGRKDYFMKCATGHFEVTGRTIDFQKCDKDGNIVVDSKRDRIDGINRLGDLVSRHLANDDVLKSMLNSYDAAVRDPNNELVHLYEIRDALVHRFHEKSKKKAAHNQCWEFPIPTGMASGNRLTSRLCGRAATGARVAENYVMPRTTSCLKHAGVFEP